MLKRVLVGLVGAIMLADVAFAGPLENGNAAYGRENYVEALKWYQLAAKQGNAVAQYNLGVMYDQGGRLIPENDAEAVKWYRLAAMQGDARAQSSLGAMYAFGSDAVPKNGAEAVKWLHLAAEQGIAIAKSNLGYMYEMGECVPQDFVLAHMWFNLGAAGGDWLDGKNRDKLAGQMTRDQVAEAQRMAREWLAKHPQ